MRCYDSIDHASNARHALHLDLTQLKLSFLVVTIQSKVSVYQSTMRHVVLIDLHSFFSSACFLDKPSNTLPICSFIKTCCGLHSFSLPASRNSSVSASCFRGPSIFFPFRCTLALANLVVNIIEIKSCTMATERDRNPAT